MNGNGRYVTGVDTQSDPFWIGKLSMALALVDKHPPVAKDTLNEFLKSNKPSTELADMLRREMGKK